MVRCLRFRPGESSDPALVAGDKSGVSETKFYKRLIDKADRRYKEHLDEL